MKTYLTTAIALATSLAIAAPPFKQTSNDKKPSFFSSDAEEIDAYAGLGAARDAEQIEFAKQIVANAKRERGTVKISTWSWNGKDQWYAQRLIERRGATLVWQGPNPPMGYHTCQRTYQIIDYSKEQGLANAR